MDLAAVGTRAGSTLAAGGPVRVNGRLAGSARAPRISADIAFDELAAGPVKARAGAARLGLADGVLSVTQLKARAFNGSASGSAAYELAHPDRTHVTLVLRDASAAALEEIAGLKSGVAGRLDADLDARGDLRDVTRAQTHVRVSAREVRLPEPLAPLGSGTIDAEARGERGRSICPRGCELAGDQARGAGQATLDGPTALRLTLTGELARLAPLVGQSRASGDAVLEAELRGRWRDPVLAGKLELRSPAVADSRADQSAALRADAALAAHHRREPAPGPRSGRRHRGPRLASTGSLAIPSVETVGVDLVAKTQDAGLEDARPGFRRRAAGAGRARERR